MTSKTYKMLVSNIGKEGADIVVQFYGGSTLYIPNEPTDGLRSELGNCNSVNLCDRFRGEMLPVPKRDEVQRCERNRAIFAARQGGASLRQLVRQFRLTERHISTILSTHQATDKPATATVSSAPPAPLSKRKANGKI